MISVSCDYWLLFICLSAQLDNVCSLVRLGCEPKVRPSLPSLVKYTQQLVNCEYCIVLSFSRLLSLSLSSSCSKSTNCFLFLLSAFLHTSPPFSELPCILEVDSFHMLVNLHFTLSSLFAAVTCPHGPSGPNGRNPVLPTLIGITDQHLVKITAASHILQYLITCPPSTAMDVDTRKPKISFIMKKLTILICIVCTAVKASSSGPEFGTGVGLQELWLKYRKLARYIK